MLQRLSAIAAPLTSMPAALPLCPTCVHGKQAPQQLSMLDQRQVLSTGLLPRCITCGLSSSRSTILRNLMVTTIHPMVLMACSPGRRRRL